MPQSIYLPPCRGCEAAVVLPVTWMLGDELITSAALPCIRGGCRFTCRLAAEIIGGDSRLFAASPVDARRHSRDLPPWKQQEAAVVPPATWRPLSSYSPLAVDAWRISANLPPRRGCEAAVALPATWMPKSSYLLPRRRYEAAVALPATFKPGDQSRPTCCLVMYARRLSANLPS